MLADTGALAATRTWVGLGSDGLWTTTANWAGSAVPAVADDVVFSSSAVQKGTVNNLVTSLHSITFGGGGFSISGNTLSLTNGINTTNTTGANTFVPPVILGANQSFTNLNAATQLGFIVLDLDGHGLTFRGAGTNLIANVISDSGTGGTLTNAGTGVFILTGTNTTFTGPTVLTAGTNIINSFHRRSPITWTAGTLGGTGQLGQVTASGSSAKQLRPGHLGTGILTTSNLVLNATVTNIMEINGLTPGIDYDQIVVSNGNVTLGSATLSLSFLGSLTNSFNDTFTLVNVLNPTNTVTGTFSGLPEGSAFTNNSIVYQLSYAGGDGNDVTLTTSGYVSTGNSRTWDGGATNNLWMNRTNWGSNLAPVQGDSLQFPMTAAARRTNFNDFPAETTFGFLQFDAPFPSTLDYVLSGNPLRLNDGVRVQPSAGTFNFAINGSIVISNHLAINQDQTFTNTLDGDLHIAGGVDLGGNTLSVGVRANTDIFFDAPITGSGQFAPIATGRVNLNSSNAIAGSMELLNGITIAFHGQGLGSASSGPVHVGTNAILRLQATNAIFTGSLIVLTGRLEVANTPGNAPSNTLSAPLLIGGPNAIIAYTNLGSGISPIFYMQGPITNSSQFTITADAQLTPSSIVQGGGELRQLGGLLDVNGIVHNTIIVGNSSTGGNLSGAGQIDRVICTNFGIIGPGSAFDSTLRLDPLRVGSLTMTNLTTLQIGLFPNRPGGGATNDSIIATNAPTLGGAILQVTALTNLAPNQAFTILRNNSAAPVTNTFKNFPEGALFAATNGNLALRINYAAGDGNDVVLTVLSNTAPTFAGGGTTNLTVNELVPLTYTNVITDIEQPPQIFTWTLLTPISGLALNTTNGVLTWTPTESQGQSTNTLLVKVTDSGTPPLSSTGTVIIVVREINVAPVPVPIASTNVVAGNTITIQLAANDSDIPINPLTWFATGLPAGASVSSSGLFTYTPPLSESGVKNISIKVFDVNTNALSNQSLTNTVSFAVTVLLRRLVTNTNDAGAGSFREAMLEVNTNVDGGEIDFAIPGAGPFKITPASNLPGLTRFTVIDGYTQTNSQPNTNVVGDSAVIMIELSGETGISGPGIAWGGFGSGQPAIIRGLCINRFTNATALVSGCASCGFAATAGSVVDGCFIGTDITGTFALPNGRGIQYLQTFNARIGGPDPSQRNIISGNQFYGIEPVQGGDGHNLKNITIQNNYIGTDHTGTNALGNGSGGINAPTGGVGGPGFDASNCLIADNVISANGALATGPGVNWGGPTNRFLRNKIGVGADGSTALGNAGSGFDLFTSDSTIGGTNVADANLIANNGSRGITLSSGSRNAFLGNSIFHNGGFGIDLANTGRTSNDLGDSDTGPNDLQNFPILTSVVPAAGLLTISGTLNSLSNTVYRLEFFHTPDFAPNNQPQAATFLGSTNVTTDAAGNISFSASIFTNLPTGGFITATATDPAGNTSELSDGLTIASLKIMLAGSQIRVLWLTNLTGFILQSNVDIAQSAGWSNVLGVNGISNINFFRDFPSSNA
ncbi:MAG TPA: hypothetical protein VLT36_05575, partial [Candidatus Dormibacteraeota bacterium]|nr:hypothetical protein [Candidatus Dormibacteraeota bacterium]